MRLRLTSAQPLSMLKLNRTKKNFVLMGELCSKSEKERKRGIFCLKQAAHVAQTNWILMGIPNRFILLRGSPFIPVPRTMCCRHCHCCNNNNSSSCCCCFWLRQLSIVHHVTIFCCDKWQLNQIANGRLTVYTHSTTPITPRLAASVGLTEPYWYAAHGVHIGTGIKTRINRRPISCVPCTTKPLSGWLQQ